MRNHPSGKSIIVTHCHILIAVFNSNVPKYISKQIKWTELNWPFGKWNDFWDPWLFLCSQWACCHCCCYNCWFINIWFCLSWFTMLLPCLSNDSCRENNKDFLLEFEPLVHMSVCDWTVENWNNSTFLFYRSLKGKCSLWYLWIILKQWNIDTCTDWPWWKETVIFLHLDLWAGSVVVVSVDCVLWNKMCAPLLQCLGHILQVCSSQTLTYLLSGYANVG